MAVSIMLHHELVTTRRDFLARTGGGLGMLALWSLLEREGRGNHPPKQPHFPAKAKAVIWCFLDGGPSHIDLFDPKPELTKLHGEPLPSTFKRPVTAMGRTAHTPLLASKRTFKQHGRSGIWVSDWYPEIATCVDDIAVIRSCHADGLNHVGSVCQMNTGDILGGRPCLGSWSTYGLGSASESLPGYVVMCDYPEDPPGGPRNWSTGFMPSVHQGTKFREGKDPVLYLRPQGSNPPRPPFVRGGENKPGSLPFVRGEEDRPGSPPYEGGVGGVERQRAKLDFIQELNRRHLAARADESDLEARIAAYELGYKMQAAAPEAVDLAQESEETKKLYGLDQKETEKYGRNCLLARRLVERGVRFVQLYSGSGSKWDAHANVEGNHSRYCKETDRPIAGLLKDLKRRGLLDSTLVIWGGEFGRTPMSESGNGRDHNPWGFTVWMAGGGIKGGVTYGATDEIGLYAVENKVHVHDLHATILHCLGLDHKKLTYPHNGRDERATINGGRVVKDILV
jgi:hypothetical protein